eukprot:3478002-Amphidinium_carterae.2
MIIEYCLGFYVGFGHRSGLSLKATDSGSRCLYATWASRTARCEWCGRTRQMLDKRDVAIIWRGRKCKGSACLPWTPSFVLWSVGCVLRTQEVAVAFDDLTLFLSNLDRLHDVPVELLEWSMILEVVMSQRLIK